MHVEWYKRKFFWSMPGWLAVLILLSSSGEFYGKPIIHVAPDAIPNNFINVSMHCDYNLLPEETFLALYWQYGGPEIIYQYLADGSGGPQGDWVERLMDVVVNDKEHHMILNGSWCDSDMFTCLVYREFDDGTGSPESSDTNLSGSKKEYRVLLNGIVDITNSSHILDEPGVGFIEVTLLWNGEMTLYITDPNDDTTDEVGTPSGSDRCTYSAKASADFNVTYGGSISFSLEADFGNTGTQELLGKADIAHWGRPLTPQNFVSLPNTTSQSVTLQWVPNSDGGRPQVFVLCGRIQGDSDYTIINSSIPDTGSDITYTVIGLDPETTYQFLLTAKNSIGDSDSQTAYGTTEVRPYMEDIDVSIEDGYMIVTWTLIGIPQTDDEYPIGVAVEYTENSEDKRYPEQGSADAREEQLDVPGDFDPNSILVILILIYERDLDVPSVETEYQYIPNGGLSGGEIAGIVNTL